MDSMDPIVLICKHNGSQLTIELMPDATYRQLQTVIAERTHVPPERQKIIGLCPGRVLPEDNHDIYLRDMGMTPTRKFLLVGSPDEPISLTLSTPKSPQRSLYGYAPTVVMTPSLASLPSATVAVSSSSSPVSSSAMIPSSSASTVAASAWLDDHITKLPPSAQEYLRDSLVLERLRMRIAETKIDFINPPRPGKKLLVLDIDFTIFDMKSIDKMGQASTVLKRPHTDAFLTYAYEHFDLVFWSQTTWNWIEAKLTEMRILFATSYRICSVLDRSSMFPVVSIHKGHLKTHEVKPLQVLWSLLGQQYGYGPHNTLHIDDLSRNFALNPTNGIKVRAYKHAPLMCHEDKELVYLQKYLELVHDEADYSKLDHNHWRRKVMTPEELELHEHQRQLLRTARHNLERSLHPHDGSRGELPDGDLQDD
jgi:ubiquitin-like domain-containing CTD phosphatase 1